MKYDVIIVGSGAAGLSAALYARRYAMKTLVIAGEFGGETSTAGKIENYPGIISIDGGDFMLTMKKQVELIGAELKEGRVVSIEKSSTGFAVKTEKETFETKTVILATGSRRRHLGLPNEKELVGKGVHFLAEYAEKIYLIVRNKEVVAEPINLEQMKKLGDKVEVLLEHEIKEIVGEKMLEKLVLSSSKHEAGKELDDLVVDGMFIEIGFDPDTTFAKQLGIETDQKGYMMVDNGMKTNVPGVFAAGDATNHFGSFKQDITAAAMGAVAATSAYEYGKTNA